MHKLHKDNTLTVTLSLRKHLPLFVIEFIVLLFLFLVFLLLPQGGYELIEFNSRSSLVLNRTTYLIAISPVLLFMLGIAIDKILYTTSFKIQLTPKNLEYTYGIFYKTVESVDMHVILDYATNRGPVDQMLGLTNIVINSEDIRTPEIKFIGLLESDASAIINYLQDNAANTIVEYLVNNKKDLAGIGGGNIDPKDLSDLQLLEDQQKKKKNRQDTKRNREP